MAWLTEQLFFSLLDSLHLSFCCFIDACSFFIAFSTTVVCCHLSFFWRLVEGIFIVHSTGEHFDFRLSLITCSPSLCSKNNLVGFRFSLIPLTSQLIDVHLWPHFFHSLHLEISVWHEFVFRSTICYVSGMSRKWNRMKRNSCHYTRQI